MRFYAKLLWIVWMYISTVVMTMCVVLWAFFYAQAMLLHPQGDQRPAQCLEQGGAWDAETKVCVKQG